MLPTQVMLSSQLVRKVLLLTHFTVGGTEDQGHPTKKWQGWDFNSDFSDFNLPALD